MTELWLAVTVVLTGWIIAVALIVGYHQVRFWIWHRNFKRESRVERDKWYAEMNARGFKI